MRQGTGLGTVGENAWFLVSAIDRDAWNHLFKDCFFRVLNIYFFGTAQMRPDAMGEPR
jgi:hypothetical protein